VTVGECVRFCAKAFLRPAAGGSMRTCENEADAAESSTHNITMRSHEKAIHKHHYNIITSSAALHAPSLHPVIKPSPPSSVSAFESIPRHTYAVVVSDATAAPRKRIHPTNPKRSLVSVVRDRIDFQNRLPPLDWAI
jgi:hypothetical protein